MTKLQIAIQMDPLNKLHYESDSTLVLATEAQNRGHKIFIYEPKDLILKDGQLFANAILLKIIKKKTKVPFGGVILLHIQYSRVKKNICSNLFG